MSHDIIRSELIDRCRVMIFTAARNWRRSINVDSTERDIIVAALEASARPVPPEPSDAAVEALKKFADRANWYDDGHSTEWTGEGDPFDLACQALAAYAVDRRAR